MRLGVGIVNLVLGSVYTSYGVMTLIEMKRGWRTLGFSHFGAAWVAMAFTCGPHHLAHGLHLTLEGRAGGPLDLLAVAVGFPAGVVWFLLRIEAFAGGRGDRALSRTPGWLFALPTLAGVYVTMLGYQAYAAGRPGLAFTPTITPNLLLIVVYTVIGYLLLRTQLRDHAQTGGWSVSGLSLGIVFPTCALMHGVFALYMSNGRYHYDPHSYVIDWLAVPAAVYFLGVVWSLYRNALRDWNLAPEAQARVVVNG